MRIQRLVVPLAAACAAVGCAKPSFTDPTSVIVFVADGAGVPHWTLADYAADSDLAVRRMPVAGLMNTAGSDHEVTGSAPGATAIATGVRTFMGAVSVGPDSLPRETVLEVAHSLGWATGLVTTTWLMDATPAAFGAHATSRGELLEIMRQMTSRPITVLLGGGDRVFELAARNGAVGFRDSILARYTYVQSAEALERAVAEESEPVLGLFAPGDLPRAPERSPNLVEMTRAALRILERDPDGFFLMVENEGSDTEAHRNSDRDVLTAEMLAFDAAVAVALEYHESHPGTLILVTADHETGGVHLTRDQNRDMVLGYATGDHTAALVPFFAIGPGAERFGGLRDNDEVGRTLLDLVRR